MHNIRLITQTVDKHILLLQKLGVLQQAQNLTEESNGLLVELLRVANVGRDDLVERQVLGGIAALGQRRSVLLRLDGKLAADGILGRHDVLVDVIDSEPHC